MFFEDFLWVEGDVCEVQVTLENHLPIELKVVDMVSENIPIEELKL
jgi:hypothetical protein